MAMQWQPMETAPKDGRKILLCVGMLFRLETTMGWWDPFQENWQDWTTDYIDEPPVCWMPLPEPPPHE